MLLLKVGSKSTRKKEQSLRNLGSGSRTKVVLIPDSTKYSILLLLGYWIIVRILIPTGKSCAVVIMCASFTHPQHSWGSSSSPMRSADVKQLLASARNSPGFEISNGFQNKLLQMGTIYALSVDIKSTPRSFTIRLPR